MEQNLKFGALHRTLGDELSSGMKRLRAEVLCYVEMLGLPRSQEEAFKSTVKAATTEFWSSYERTLATEIAKFGTIETK